MSRLRIPVTVSKAIFRPLSITLSTGRNSTKHLPAAAPTSTTLSIIWLLSKHGGGSFGGGPSRGVPGCVKCQPGAMTPTPGSDLIVFPSSLTVPVPITIHLPASWSKDQNKLFSPGCNPSKLGNCIGAGTSKLVAPPSASLLNPFAPPA